MLRKKIKRAASNNPTESKSHPDTKLLKQSHHHKSSDITSPFFDSMQHWQKIYEIECRLSVELKSISFLSTNITAVYNPIEYAADLHCAYLKKFLNTPKPVLFIGMNPGPFGMVQTGVNQILKKKQPININTLCIPFYGHSNMCIAWVM